MTTSRLVLRSASRSVRNAHTSGLVQSASALLCAEQRLDYIAEKSCPVCDQAVDEYGTCRNWLCADPSRRIERIRAIAYSSGSLRDTIHRYKYDRRVLKLVGKWSNAAVSAPGSPR
jgi:predicted amidophosphoribosyltransferase